MTCSSDRGSGLNRRFRLCVVFVLAWILAPAACAEEVLVAVASNFAEAMDRLKEDFEAGGSYELKVSAGSTGKLYAQIVNGAPFDVFLAADQRRPRLLVEEGRASAESRFTFAVGRLTLWSPDPKRVRPDGPAALRAGSFRKLAIANPRLAPYGEAAREVLQALGQLQSLSGRLVLGENIGQAHALVATGNAELGLVSLSQVLSPRNAKPGSRWDVPARLHSPIRQDAVLLARASGNSAAKAFLSFLGSAEARSTIRRFGYEVE